MLKFLFRGAAKADKVNQRQTVETLLADLNAIMAEMPEKPVVSVNPNTGELGLALPEQMPDEALALPAPDQTGEVA